LGFGKRMSKKGIEYYEQKLRFQRITQLEKKRGHSIPNSLRRQLSTHQVVTVRLPTTDGTGLGLVESSRANSRNWKSSVGDYVLRVSLLSHPRTSSNGGCSHGVLEWLRREFSKELVLYARQILI
jgi:hypothetical protein